MSTVDEANPAVWEKRLSEIRQLLNKEKNSQAQKKLKSEKNLIEQKINNYRLAEENLLDAYLIYSDNNQSRLESIASPLKENIVRNLRTSGTLSSEELQKLLESPELDFLGGKDCAQYFDNLKQAAEFKKNCLTIRENLEKEQIIPDLNGIEALMKSAGKTAAKQQKEDNQQKSDQKKLEKIKNIAVEEIKNRLAKKALLSDDEKYVITHPDSLERISLQQSEGKTYLNADTLFTDRSPKKMGEDRIEEACGSHLQCDSSLSPHIGVPILTIVNLAYRHACYLLALITQKMIGEDDQKRSDGKKQDKESVLGIIFVRPCYQIGEQCY